MIIKIFFLVMASRLTLFKKFENEEYVLKNDLVQITDYICGNLINRTPNYQYWYNMYSYTSKAYIVCRWREERGYLPIAKWGEAICKNNLINFFQDKTHQKCECSSVYFR